MLQEETEHILAGVDPPPIFIWQPVGLHDNLEVLEATLDQALADVRAGGGRPSGLLFGFGCLPEMRAFAAARGLALLPTKNCLTALAGEEGVKNLEKDRTLVASPAWVRKMWLGRAGTAGGWQADDYRQNFGRYDRVVVLDPGLTPLTDEEIITCYDLIQVPLEIQPLGLGHFRQLLEDFFNASSK
jgi:hypothetical protein